MIQPLIADDHQVVRRGLKELLGESQAIHIAGEATSASEVLDKVKNERWDVVVLDINQPEGRGLELLRQLRNGHPDLPVIILAVSAPELSVSSRSGTNGHATKEGEADEGTHSASVNGRCLSPGLAERLQSLAEATPGQAPHDRLSDREHQVLSLLASGRTVSEAAGDLKLSVKTISTYRSRVLAKMNMRTNAELTYYAMRHRLVE